MEFIEKALKVKLTFTEEVLGLSPASSVISSERLHYMKHRTQNLLSRK